MHVYSIELVQEIHPSTDRLGAPIISVLSLIFFPPLLCIGATAESPVVLLIFFIFTMYHPRTKIAAIAILPTTAPATIPPTGTELQVPVGVTVT